MSFDFSPNFSFIAASGEALAPFGAAFFSAFTGAGLGAFFFGSAVFFADVFAVAMVAPVGARGDSRGRGARLIAERAPPAKPW
jgi:hypothetical protein